MGSPTLYWYPPGTLTPRALTLGVRVTDLGIEDLRDRWTAAPAAGVPVHHDLGGFRRLSMALERRTTAATIREIRTLSGYLQAGGVLALCLDAGKVYGGWPSTAPKAGDASVTLAGGNRFTSLASGAVVAGDEVTIESAAPECRREWAAVESVSGNTLTLSGGVLQDYSTGPIFVRYADFYPALFVPEDALEGCFPTSDHRLNWSWNLTLVETPGVLAALYDARDSLTQTIYQQGMSAEIMAGAARNRYASAPSQNTRTPLSRW